MKSFVQCIETRPKIQPMHTVARGPAEVAIELYNTGARGLHFGIAFRRALHEIEALGRPGQTGRSTTEGIGALLGCIAAGVDLRVGQRYRKRGLGVRMSAIQPCPCIPSSRLPRFCSQRFGCECLSAVCLNECTRNQRNVGRVMAFPKVKPSRRRRSCGYQVGA